MITQSRLKELLHYNPETGIFTWTDAVSNIRSRCRPNDIAGYKHPYGYIIIKIDQIKYPAHRLAFLYMTGNFPIYETDHINTIRDDNRWDNLRDIPRKLNQENKTKVQSNNKSGKSGVHYCNTHKKWVARIKHKQKTISLGYFDSKDDAIAARLNGEKQYFKYSRV